MTRNFTLINFIVFTGLATAFTPMGATAQVVSTPQTINQYSFNMMPVLVSGNPKQVNAIYRFSGVSSGVDALVKIVGATGGASVDIFDDNAISKPEGFSPKIAVPANSTGLVEFSFTFVTAGSSVVMVQDTLYATAIDIDGNNTLKEIDVIDMGGGLSSYQFGTPEIIVTKSGTAFTGKNVAGNEYDGIDTSAKQVMFTVINNLVGGFTYKCGAQNSGNSSISRQKSIYFRNFTYPPVVSAPLAVKYRSFDAVENNHTVLLKWVTEMEMNHSHFEVERSDNNTQFKTIGVVLDGFSATGTGKSYQFKDLDAELKDKKTVYYRLKEIDADGKGTYSKVLAVKMQGSQSSMQVLPNPFAENLVIRFQAKENGEAEIRVMGMTGQTWLSKHSTISKGNNNIQLQGLVALTPGVYVAQLIVNGVVVESRKVVKD
jgi:hypothetical protein